MKKKLLYMVALSCMAATSVKAQVFFSQNFDGKTLAQVQSETPDASQFNYAGVTDPDGSPNISIQGGKLRLDRTGGVTGNRVFFVRTTDLNPATQFIKVQFKFNAIGINSAGSTQAQFAFGEGFAENDANEDNTGWERIGISHIKESEGVYAYALRDPSGSGTINGTSSTGENTITLYLNATDSEQTYIGPDDIEHTIPAQKWNAFVNEERQFGSVFTRTPAQPAKAIKNFKFFMSGGTAVYEIDDLVMEALPVSTTPVSLVSFTGKNNGAGNELQWVTSSEQNNSHFEILRSSDGIHFTQVGSQKGNGTTQQVNSYSFTDSAPLAGVNYYKLRQIDLDGKAEEFSVIAIANILPSDNLKIYMTNDNRLAVWVNAIESGGAIAEIRNVAGQKVSDTTIQLNQGDNQFYMPLSNLNQGVYVVVIQNSDFVQRAKFVK